MEKEKLRKEREINRNNLPYRKIRVLFLPLSIALVLLTPVVILFILSSDKTEQAVLKDLRYVNSENTIDATDSKPVLNDTKKYHEKESSKSSVEPERVNYLDLVKNKTNCLDKSNEFRIVRHGNFWVLENYIKPNKPPARCHETITYTTHGDLTFLDNLAPLVKRWMAPISMAVYCPGTDYKDALESVIYLRKCDNESQLIRDFVTFHFYFDRIHTPEEFHLNLTIIEQAFECVVEAPFQYMKSKELYKAKKNLTYFVNVGRNVAREAATTHFVMASDVELYPNPGVVQDFLKMYTQLNDTSNHEVFVFPIFEVWENVTVPHNKSELVELIKIGKSIPFHSKICKSCHLVPKYDEWLKSPETNGLEIFATSKRQGRFQSWEPIYISTNREPLYEEMLNWEGKSDKMTQGFILCVLDYDFHVLNNAFLVHRPGIKLLKDSERPKFQKNNRELISKQIKPQIIQLYGDRKGCHF